MPKRKDIKSILVIGAGPIIIGQACEFDYSGTQACYALKEEGYKVILINSNPATIMTDFNVADKTYIEPITPEIVEKIIAKEKPDAILPTLGGQTALNCTIQLEKKGVLSKFDVEILGSGIEAIKNAEDRSIFAKIVKSVNSSVPRNAVASNMEEALAVVEEIGFPLIIRSSFTLGGAGGGIASNIEEFKSIVAAALNASQGNVIQIDQSLLGWKEYEMEVMCDLDKNCMMVCSVENIDPMGVHTGDSVVVSPTMTLTDKEYQKMRDVSFDIIRAVGIKAGGANIQFAINPVDGELLVIEMNPRVSRSSALASKATGFSIARIATKLAVGYRLHELKNDMGISSSLEPSLDYVVVKIPRFNFDKFPQVAPILSTSMRSVGEVMAIGRNFAEALQKGMVSLEDSLTGLNEVMNIFVDTSWPKKDFKELDPSEQQKLRDSAMEELAKRSPYRIRIIADALRFGVDIPSIARISQYDIWFIDQIRQIIEVEEYIVSNSNDILNSKIKILQIKKMGFSDARIAELVSRKNEATSEEQIMEIRNTHSLYPVYKNIDTCAAEFKSTTAYMYSCYENGHPPICESIISNRKKIIILGSGPNRIGQGIEFDYACVQACISAKNMDVEVIMINCNPETVSTDHRISNKLYFDPIVFENVFEIIKKEKSSGEFLGVVVQLGGQTPLKIVKKLTSHNIPILGTGSDIIDVCEDREKFKDFIDKIGLKQPRSSICKNLDEIKNKISDLGFPLLIRPSYVLGGYRMYIVRNMKDLDAYIENNRRELANSVILLDSFLENAIEIDVDAIADGESVAVVGVLEHIESAGIHSGDSCCTLPPYSLSKELVDKIAEQTKLIGQSLKIIGLLNVQYAIQNNEIYVLEVNARASRTIPFIAKSLGFQVIDATIKVLFGEKLSNIEIPDFNNLKFISIKKPVFPFMHFPKTNTILRPEMKSTGEIMAIDKNFDMSLIKSYLAVGYTLPKSGDGVLLSVKDEDKNDLLSIAQKLQKMKFVLFATKGTGEYLEQNNIKVTKVNKANENRPNVIDLITDKKISYVINTTNNYNTLIDEMSIRRILLSKKIPYDGTINSAKIFVDALSHGVLKKNLSVNALQDIHNIEHI